MPNTAQLVLIFIFAVAVALLLAWVLSAPAEPHYVNGKVRERYQRHGTSTTTHRENRHDNKMPLMHLESDYDDQQRRFIDWYECGNCDHAEELYPVN